MKYSFAFAALIATVAAQAMPECAQKCLADATTSASTCKVGDFACTCETANKAAIQAAGTSCVIDSCGMDKALNEVLPASEKLCAQAAAGGGAAASSAPPAASSAASMSMPTSAEGSMSLPFTTAMSTVTTSVAATATSGAASTPTGNATASTTAPVQAGAAGIAPIGGLAMLILGALAI
ncbi:hypothetical protein LZ30DRAFT_154538 [Colletotrichum cereale]|nr:hypothetical protein LZ30DRAFT_154538 [Colletotrichum cereale]